MFRWIISIAKLTSNVRDKTNLWNKCKVAARKPEAGFVTEACVLELNAGCAVPLLSCFSESGSYRLEAGCAAAGRPLQKSRSSSKLVFSAPVFVD